MWLNRIVDSCSLITASEFSLFAAHFIEVYEENLASHIIVLGRRGGLEEPSQVIVDVV